MPHIKDRIQDVYPLPSLNSFKSSMYTTPNVYVIPSAENIKTRALIPYYIINVYQQVVTQ